MCNKRDRTRVVQHKHMHTQDSVTSHLFRLHRRRQTKKNNTARKLKAENNIYYERIVSKLD